MTREEFYVLSVLVAALVAFVAGWRAGRRSGLGAVVDVDDLPRNNPPKVCRWGHTIPEGTWCKLCERGACGGAPGRDFCDMAGRCDRHSRAVRR